MSKSDKIKKTFRDSSTWKKFRHEMVVRDKVDYISGSRLLKGCQCHHLDLNPENYKNLNPDNFIMLNRNTHTFLHWIWTYYKKDKEILKRIEIVLEKMCNLNCN